MGYSENEGIDYIDELIKECKILIKSEKLNENEINTLHGVLGCLNQLVNYIENDFYE